MSKPFKRPEDNFTLVHNSLFDDVMKEVSPNAYKILLTIFRKTRGWNKTHDAISYSQLREGTGIASNTTIQKGINELEQKGMIRIFKGGNPQPDTYSLDENYTVTETVKPTVTETVKVAVTETVKTKDIVKDTIKDLKDSQPKVEDVSSSSPSDHALMVEALRVVSGMDMKIKTNAGRIVRASKDLRKAGYSPGDVMAFGEKWRRDWRYQRDKKPPALTVLLAEISKVVKEDIVAKRLDDARREIEKANG